MKDITERFYENKMWVERYAKSWLKYSGYKYDYRMFMKLLPKNAVILDAGCGPGRDVKFFMQHKLKAIGIDRSGTMINTARKLVPKGRFHVMDMEKLGFKGNYFDGIWTAGVFIHFTEKGLRNALGEFRRVLKPGGIAYICTRIGRPKRRMETFLEGGLVMINYFEKKRLAALLKDNGFKVLSSETVRDKHGRKFDWIMIFAKLKK